MENAATNLSRGKANYKPNIWNYDYLESLTNEYNGEKYEREIQTLKDQVRGLLCGSKDPLHKLELIDLIKKLALSHHFPEEITQFMALVNTTTPKITNDLYSSALCFRILRQHGHYVPSDAIVRLLDEEKLMKWDEKARNEIFEASHLEVDGECLIDRVNTFSSAETKPPSHFGVSWYNAKKHMPAENKSPVHRMGRLSFNMVQAQHQKELKEILRWWRDLRLLEVLTFTRDRIVESFLWAVGVAHEPQYGSLRKWLTKATMLVLIFDDLYDNYGSKHELEQFTIAVERWDPSEIQQLPEAIKICFWTLYNTANDIDSEVQIEKGGVEWVDFCKAMMVEARWAEKKQTPSLMEYLENGWTSSSGPLISLHILIGIGQDMPETMAAFHCNQQLIHHASLIIRLCNDQETSQDELKRGESPSSIVCQMREANVTETEARKHIKKLISDSWKKMNEEFMRCPSKKQKMMMRYIVNLARVATFIYQNGDGFGVQDGETREQVLSCLIHPLPMHMLF